MYQPNYPGQSFYQQPANYGSQTSQTTQPSQTVKQNPTKLSVFLTDCFSFGCLRGFKYFELYLRGKEELLCRVLHEKQPKKQNNWKPSLASEGLTRTALFQQASNLAPASPCNRELEKDTSKTAFLIAGYARYKRPYVWLRSNHERLVKLSKDALTDTADHPIKLNSVSDWENRDVKVWEMIAEIVSIAMSPPPSNPFEIDHDFLNQFSLETSVVITGGLLHFLRKIYLMNPEYAAEVYEDIKLLQERLDNNWDDTELIEAWESTIVEFRKTSKAMFEEHDQKILSSNDPLLPKWEKVEITEEENDAGLERSDIPSPNFIPTIQQNSFKKRKIDEDLLDKINQDEDLYNLLMSWYMSGYYSGYYQAKKERVPEKME